MFCKETGKRKWLLSNTGNASGQTWHKVVLLVREQQNDVHKIIEPHCLRWASSQIHQDTR